MQGTATQTNQKDKYGKIIEQIKEIDPVEHHYLLDHKPEI